jgi:hypothetical protein
MGRAATTYQHIITYWFSVGCLFDGYLIGAYKLTKDSIQLARTGLAGKQVNWPDKQMDKVSHEEIGSLVKDILMAILSLIKVFLRVSHSQGHSQGHFVLDSSIAVKEHFYRTITCVAEAKSYLMSKTKRGYNNNITNWFSVGCLFDGYLMDYTAIPSKTPKPLDKSGFFSPTPLGHRDNTKVLNPVHI